MTNREFLTAIASATNLDDALVTYAADALAKMDAANEKRRNTPSKTMSANAPLLTAIMDRIISVEPKTASDVANDLGVSTQKASSLLRTLVGAGQIKVTEVKVPKKGNQRAYFVEKDAVVAADEVDE